ncbi:transmembrane protein 106C isoform X3 [Hemicordylus capensis]|uniref:transmembrane protein 106C isoform X3 n=1 Tax=Hemicordylus capensis TaxID=884348 RepID=UPI0023026910|nr:transmembrane protein 106C isoform X3 [Hemicordylus capensis]
MGSSQSVGTGSYYSKWPVEEGDGGDDDEDLLDNKDREEDIARFPYVEFTGRDSITCPTCQGTGCIPTEQVNELVALIPYHDQRLKPQRTKLYVLVSVLLCLLVSGLVVFFLFPHSVLVDDNGIKVVTVWFDDENSIVVLAITATLRIRNSNFYSVAVTNLASQVNFTVKAEMGEPFSYAYFFCTFPRISVHNIMIFMRTSVKISYIGHITQSSLETHHYVDCGANFTAAYSA